MPPEVWSSVTCPTATKSTRSAREGVIARSARELALKEPLHALSADQLEPDGRRLRIEPEREAQKRAAAALQEDPLGELPEEIRLAGIEEGEAIGQLLGAPARLRQLAPQGVVAPSLRGIEGSQLTGQRFHDRSCLAMISFMISEVPPPIVMSRMSRKKRSIGYSRM